MKNMLLKAKRGISEMVGYVLLVAFVIVLSVIVYAWLKTYTPRDMLECPDDTSLMIKQANCTLVSLNAYQLRLTLQNNGLFAVGGYFIHATNASSSQELATIDLSKKVTNESNLAFLLNVSSGVFFQVGNDNLFEPNQEKTHVFNISYAINSVEIIPLRWQEQDNRVRSASCGKSKVSQIINCA